MLGEKIGEETGRITARRVLPSEGHGPKVEVSFEASGTLLGVETTTMATYESIIRPDGTIYGEGQGLVMGQGGEAATWVGQGVGRFTGGGAVSYRGAVYFQTASEKWAHLNSIASIYEYEVDADGNARSVSWEWK
jgi:hypothetical protein